MWTSGGLLQGEHIFDHLTEKNIPYYVGDLDPEDKQIEKTLDGINNRSINFAYLLFGKLDHLMHMEGTKSPKIGQLLNYYDKTIRNIVTQAKKNYDEVDFLIFSDHGMHDITKTYDLQRDIAKTDLKFGLDFVAVYDSTMARFWYLNDQARKKITDLLQNIPKGKNLSTQELQSFGTFFPDHRYGETIFLMNSGTLITPSFMGLKRIPGMHGYHPDDPESFAMILSNKKLPENIVSIKDIYSLLIEDCNLA